MTNINERVWDFLDWKYREYAYDQKYGWVIDDYIDFDISATTQRSDARKQVQDEFPENYPAGDIDELLGLVVD